MAKSNTINAARKYRKIDQKWSFDIKSKMFQKNVSFCLVCFKLFAIFVYINTKAKHNNTMNPYEQQMSDFRQILREELPQVIASMTPVEKVTPGLDLSEYICLKMAAEQLGVGSQTLWNHREMIGFTKQFGQIFFKRKDLISYMESGKPQKAIKKIMYTRKKAA